MKRHLEHAWTTATLVATAALAIALAIAAILFTRATAEGAELPPPAQLQQLAVAPLWKNVTRIQRLGR
jgi:hypothetical protein